MLDEIKHPLFIQPVHSWSSFERWSLHFHRFSKLYYSQILLWLKFKNNPGNMFLNTFLYLYGSSLSMADGLVSKNEFLLWWFHWNETKNKNVLWFAVLLQIVLIAMVAIIMICYFLVQHLYDCISRRRHCNLRWDGKTSGTTDKAKSYV